MTTSPVKRCAGRRRGLGPRPRLSSCTRGPHHCNVLVFLFCAVASLSAEAVEPGRYEIVARTEMPHLEENLRHATTRERRCLRGDEIASLFPILQHPSLEGCTLGGDAMGYRLVCASPQVATGSARLDAAEGRIAGLLEIKMGGKNMTFAQRIEAARQGECESP